MSEDVDALDPGLAVVRALVAVADERYREERFDDALVSYAGVLARSGVQLGGALGDDVARVARDSGVVAVDDADAAFELPADDPADPDSPLARVRRNRSWAILRIGLTLDKLDRHEHEIDAYDELVDRFGLSSDSRIRSRVAWALYYKAITLRDLARAEDAIGTFEVLIATFADATDPKVRERVSWGLRKKAEILRDLGRDTEARSVYQSAAARQDELTDPELESFVAWCLMNEARELANEGQIEDAIAANQGLIDRFADTTDPVVQEYVAGAFANQAYYFETLGRPEDGLEVCDRMVDQFNAPDLPIKVRKLVIGAMGRKAGMLEDLERIDESETAYDNALAAVMGSDEPILRRQAVEVLVDKGTMLDRAGRFTAAAVVYDSAATAAGQLTDDPEDPDEVLILGVAALFYRAVCLASIDGGASSALTGQLSDLLGDIIDPSPSNAPPTDTALPEDKIATVLAELYEGDCWLTFATSPEDRASFDDMAARALELYQMTEAWFVIENAEPDTPALGAVSMIRHIADGYALVARDWHGRRTSLSLPSPLLLEYATRESGIAEWAAEHGHPLPFSEAEDLADELVRDQEVLSQNRQVDLAGKFVASIRHYEMLELLCASPCGRSILRHPKLRDHAIWRLQEARQTAGWTVHQREEAAGIAAVGIFIAQAFFVATHSTDERSHRLFPDRSLLRKMLTHTDAYAWIDAEDIKLPEWLEQPSD